MKITSISVACLLVSGGQAAANPCLEAAREAQASYGIPNDLLVGIVATESGGDPFATNHRGDGRYHASADDAVHYVRGLRARGEESVDVGCAQINMRWHPEAFDTVRDGFDPESNLDYAAKYLVKLAGPEQDWSEAVGKYHSPSRPGRAAAYRERVEANLDSNVTLSTKSLEREGRAPDTSYKAGNEVARVSEMDGAIGNM